jgi:hypothetical protein
LKFSPAFLNARDRGLGCSEDSSLALSMDLLNGFDCSSRPGLLLLVNIEGDQSEHYQGDDRDGESDQKIAPRQQLQALAFRDGG